jgi:hypothetical protein
VCSLNEVLRLADEQYKQGRSSGHAVDYSEFEERVARATAKVEQDVHRIALSRLDVDVPFIRVWGKQYRACFASSARTDRSADRSSWSARCIGNSVSAKVRCSVPSLCAPA